MIEQQAIIKMIFGFKAKYLRQQQQLSLEELAERAGLSKSYLHDIEKGKKYPKVDKINAMAQALGVDYDFMVSTRASKKLQPIIDLLTSDFVKEFPLELFGISPDKLFELFSNTPDKVNAFISTLFKITRNYQMQREHLYLAALRSYQDMYDNYFEELETAVRQFREELGINGALPYTSVFLEGLLLKNFGVKTDRQAMPHEKELKRQRSFYSPKHKTLFLNEGLSSAQENFLLGRELAFQYLKFADRPYFTRIVEADSFERLLNNFKASYFSVALLMDEQLMVEDIRDFAQMTSWNPEAFLRLLDKYDVTPEMLLQRLTNLLPRHFGIKDLFFLRLVGDESLQRFQMTKELHLSQLHNPYANELNEHYCRRWVSVNIIKKVKSNQQLHNDTAPAADAQISQYWETPNRYLCISVAKPDFQNPARGTSVTVGLLVNDTLRRLFRFLDSPELPTRIVNTTCERCSLSNCEARAAAPAVLEQQRKQGRIVVAGKRLGEGGVKV
ncbi:MAG: helix-turn-helix domain-containing protein [Lewinellaceae bacterium]|nr:helix-turn-helix domain-containing protein [Phaeodactylibacter sp.]MCB9038846.1 helix-turn-helix domain-containing protein [Lewinellaceae bacterium]